MIYHCSIFYPFSLSPLTECSSNCLQFVFRIACNMKHATCNLLKKTDAEPTDIFHSCHNFHESSLIHLIENTSIFKCQMRWDLTPSFPSGHSMLWHSTLLNPRCSVRVFFWYTVFIPVFLLPCTRTGSCCSHACVVTIQVLERRDSSHLLSTNLIFEQHEEDDTHVPKCSFHTSYSCTCIHVLGDYVL